MKKEKKVAADAKKITVRVEFLTITQDKAVMIPPDTAEANDNTLAPQCVWIK